VVGCADNNRINGVSCQQVPKIRIGILWRQVDEPRGANHEFAVNITNRHDLCVRFAPESLDIIRPLVTRTYGANSDSITRTIHAEYA
jgi:hypothetical protein